MPISPDGLSLEVGVEVEANFRGMTFRPATITKVRPDGSVDVTYFDGDMEYRVKPELIRSPQALDLDANLDNNQNYDYNNGGPPVSEMASRVGEVTGVALRKTGKHLSAFGGNVLKHLLAEDEEPKRSRSERRPKDRDRKSTRGSEKRNLSNEKRDRGGSVERRGTSSEGSGSRTRLQTRKDSSRGGSVERRGYSIDRNDSQTSSSGSQRRSSTTSPQPRVIRPPRTPAPGDRLDADGRRSSRGVQPAQFDGYQSLDDDDMHDRLSDSMERSATNPKQREMPAPLRKDASKRKIDRSGEAITVGIRIRPLVTEKWETKIDMKECFYAELDRTVLEADENGSVLQSWSFDYVWGNQVSTETVFNELALPIVDKVIDGLNGTIFAYGQTAAGKTYSMFGNEQNPGITSRAVFQLFDLVKESKFSQFLIRGSFIEIYNEEFVDLLAVPTESETKLRIMEDSKTGPFVKGAIERLVEHPDQILDMIQFGEKNRHYGSTNMNDKSSRSHVIVRLVIKRGFVSSQKGMNPDTATTTTSPSSRSNDLDLDTMAGYHHGGGGVGGGEQVWHANPKIPQRVSSLHFVDLAGSEKSKKTGATGAQLKESNAINKSLLTLGTVINRLSDGAKGQHVPYRDSKLTHLLSASLGGNASTAMLACISPTDFNREETNSTLRYASRAKKIVNIAEVNEVDNLESFMDNYWNEVELMKRQILEAKQAGYDMTAESERSKELVEKNLKKVKETLQNDKIYYEKEIENLKLTKEQELDMLKSDYEKSVERLEGLVFEREQTLNSIENNTSTLEQKLDFELNKNMIQSNKLIDFQQNYERKCMQVEELLTLRIEELEDCDHEVQKQFIEIETKNREIERLTGLFGDEGEESGKNWVQVTHEQDEVIADRDATILQLSQQLEIMTHHAGDMEEQMTSFKQQLQTIESEKDEEIRKLDEKNQQEKFDIAQETTAHIAELENALDETSLQLHESTTKLKECESNLSSKVEECNILSIQYEKAAKGLEEERTERRKFRDENNMLRGRLSAMDKIGAATVAVVLGGDHDEQTHIDENKEEKISFNQSQIDELNDKISELQHENESLTAISADYKDHVSTKFSKYELTIEGLNQKIKILTEQAGAGETQRSIQLRQELRDFEEKYNTDTHKLRVAYMELEKHYMERDSEALTLIGEKSPLVQEALRERDQTKSKLGALQQEQDELIADLEKSVNKVSDQDVIIETLTGHLEDFSKGLAEQGEDLRVLLEENAFLRIHIDRTSRVAAAAVRTRDGEKSTAWTKEVSDLGACIQNSVADELRSAYDEVRISNQEVVQLRVLLENAQEKSVIESYRMAQYLRSFKGTMEEVNDVEIRLADLHDQAASVSSAHEKLLSTEKNYEEYKKVTDIKISQLELAARPQGDIREVSLKLLPEGFILWYHSHVNPQVSALADPDHRENLLKPHPKAYVSSVMPEGILLDIDRNAVASELLSFPDLEDQLESLVPEPLSERQFWLNYFSHKHGVKIDVAEEADKLASSGQKGFIMRSGASAHLRQQFVEAMREAGVHLKMHQETEAIDVVLWLKTPTELAWSPDLTQFPPKEQYSIPFSEISSVETGKQTEILLNGLAQWADPDCCFSFLLNEGGSLDYEAGSKDENFTFIEGVNMLLQDAAANQGKPSYNAMELGKANRAEPYRPEPSRGGFNGGDGNRSDAGGGGRNEWKMEQNINLDEHNYGPPPPNAAILPQRGDFNDNYNGGGGGGYNGNNFNSPPANYGNNGGNPYNNNGQLPNNGYGSHNNGKPQSYNGGGGTTQNTMNTQNNGGGGYMNQPPSYADNSLSRGGGGVGDAMTRFEKWLAEASLDIYLPKFSALGINSIEALSRIQPNSADQVARQVGMRPNEVIKFTRLQGQLQTFTF